MKHTWLATLLVLINITAHAQKAHEHFEEYQDYGRKAWIDYIHRTAPGTDWRKINRENSQNRYRQLASRGVADTFAFGKLSGYWVEKGSRNNAGRSHVCEYDSLNQRLIVGSDGGNVWLGNLDGTGWHSINDGLNFGGFWMIKAVKLQNGNTRILCVTERADVYYTDNDGKVWKTATGLGNVKNWGNITFGVMANDPKHTIAVLVHEWDYTLWKAVTSVYTSTNMASTFTRDTLFYDTAFGGSDQFALWTSPYGSGNIYLLADSNVLLRNANASYSHLGVVNRPTRGRTLLAGIETAAGTTLYAYFNKTIFRSVDTGQTWNQQSTGNKSPYHKTFYCGLTNASEVYLGEVECWKSSNGGGSFAKFCNWWDYYPDIANKLHADIQSILAFRNPQGDEVLYIQTDGGTYRSEDALGTVQNLSLEGLNISQYYSVFTNKTDTRHVYAGSQDQGFQAGEDTAALLSLKQVISGDYGHIVSADSGETSIWMNYPGFADCYPQIKTNFTHKGRNFTDMGMKDQLWIPPLLAEPWQPNVCWLGGGSKNGGQAHLYKLMYDKSSNTVSSEEDTFDFGAGKSDRISAMAISPHNHPRRYVMTDKGLFWYSTDGGNSWAQSQGFKGPGANYLYGAAIQPSATDSLTVYVGGSGYSNPGFYRSTDGGNTFTPFTDGLPKTMMYELAADPHRGLVFAATDNGPYVFSEDSLKWEHMGGTSAPDQTYWSVDYIPRTATVRFATYGRGIWDFVPGVLFGTAVPQVSEAGKLLLSPVPATDYLHISSPHGIAAQSGELLVFASDGRLVMQMPATHRLFVGHLPTGSYQLLLRNGRMLAQGKFVVQR